MRLMHDDIWTTRRGDTEADTTDEAVSKHPLIVCKQTTIGQRMHCVKRLGQSPMARDFDRQVAEIQIRIAVLNRYTAYGIPIVNPIG